MSFPIGSLFAPNQQPIQTNYPTGYGLIQDGLIRWYDISQTASYQSSSVNVWNDLKGNAAINFTSSNAGISAFPKYINIPNQSGTIIYGLTDTTGLPSGNSPFTIGMWFKSDNASVLLPANSDRKLLYALGTLSGRNNAFNIVNPTTSNTGEYPNTYISTGSLEPNYGMPTVSTLNAEWNMFVFTHTGSINRYYNSGNPNATVTGSFNVTLPSTVWLFGQPNTTAPFFNWKGSVGQIFIYNRALSNQEVTENYLTTKGNYI